MCRWIGRRICSSWLYCTGLLHLWSNSMRWPCTARPVVDTDEPIGKVRSRQDICSLALSRRPILRNTCSRNKNACPTCFVFIYYIIATNLNPLSLTVQVPQSTINATFPLHPVNGWMMEPLGPLTILGQQPSPVPIKVNMYTHVHARHADINTNLPNPDQLQFRLKSLGNLP